MIKTYNLGTDGLKFKADFNWKYEKLWRVFYAITPKSYLKIDVVKEKHTGIIYLSRRTADFKQDSAMFEVVGLRKI